MVESVAKSCPLRPKIFSHLTAWSICRDTRRQETIRDTILKKNTTKSSHFYSQDHEDKPCASSSTVRHPACVSRHRTDAAVLDENRKKKKKRECVEGGAEIQEGLPPHDYQYLSVFRLYTRPPLTSKVWSVKRTHTVSWELHNHARGKHTHTRSRHTSAVCFCTVMTEQDKDPTSSDKGFNPNLSRL